jgi:hypothetical protein
MEIIGWREHVALPDLKIASIAAKIDTGARTSALHADDQKLLWVDGQPWVEFTVPVGRGRSSERVRAPLVDERQIKNTSGVPEQRLVVHTKLLLGRHRWDIELSLADRANMGFDIILGRTAIRRRGILVNPGRSFLLNSPGQTANQDGDPLLLAPKFEGQAK